MASTYGSLYDYYPLFGWCSGTVSCSECRGNHVLTGSCPGAGIRPDPTEPIFLSQLLWVLVIAMVPMPHEIVGLLVSSIVRHT